MYPGSGEPEKFSKKDGLKLDKDLELVEVMKSIVLLLF